MRLTRNKIALSGNFGKIDPRIHFDVFQITLTYVRAILKKVKIDLGLFFPNCPQSHAITSTNYHCNLPSKKKINWFSEILKSNCFEIKSNSLGETCDTAFTTKPFPQIIQVFSNFTISMQVKDWIQKAIQW